MNTVSRRQFVKLGLVVPFGWRDQAKPSATTQPVALRGKLVCLTEALAATHRVEPDCVKRGHVFALQTATRLHTILPTDSAAAIWLDDRFRQMDLQIVGRTFPTTDALEVIKYQVWRGAQLFDCEYYCAVCNISTHKLEACVCCQDPVVYREVPVATTP